MRSEPYRSNLINSFIVASGTEKHPQLHCVLILDPECITIALFLALELDSDNPSNLKDCPYCPEYFSAILNLPREDLCELEILEKVVA